MKHLTDIVSPAEYLTFGLSDNITEDEAMIDRKAVEAFVPVAIDCVGEKHFAGFMVALTGIERVLRKRGTGGYA